MKTIKNEIKKMAEAVAKATTVNEYDLIVFRNNLKINKALSVMKELYIQQEVDEVCNFYVNAKREYSHIRAELFEKEREQTILDILRE